MNRAFSLVELSIVLVILGLLTGGILAGQSLIHAAELRAVSTEYNRYVSATQTFRDKYFQLPGDMNNANKFWGAADGGTGDTVGCATTTTNDARTCNGSGNGRIGDGTSSNESLRFWQHLANAGLIEGQYTGIAGTPAANQIIIGTNVPRSKLSSSSYWYPQTEGTHTGDPGRMNSAEAYNNTFFFGGWSGGTYRGNLKPEDAWNIDTKMDDGKPGIGKIKAPWDATYSASGTFCTNAANAAATSADYLLTNSNTDCEAFFTNAF